MKVWFPTLHEKHTLNIKFTGNNLHTNNQACAIIITLSSKTILCYIYFLSTMLYFHQSCFYLCRVYTSCLSNNFLYYRRPTYLQVSHTHHTVKYECSKCCHFHSCIIMQNNWAIKEQKVRYEVHYNRMPHSWNRNTKNKTETIIATPRNCFNAMNSVHFCSVTLSVNPRNCLNRI
jgi:hypothetical protein